MQIQEIDPKTDIIHEHGIGGISRQLRISRRLTLIIPLIVLSLIVFMAIFAPLLAPYDPVKISLTDRLMPPFFSEGGSIDHLLGTDKLGRDTLSRLMFGARISLSVSIPVSYTHLR